MIRKRGDWDCQCGTVNFAKRVECHRCGVKRGSLKTLVQERPGDWYCRDAACAEMNFGSRVACRKCGRDRVEGGHDTSCAVCLGAPANACIEVCGHVAVCVECAKELSKCPICQKEYGVGGFKKIYLAV